METETEVKGVNGKEAKTLDKVFEEFWKKSGSYKSFGVARFISFTRKFIEASVETPSYETEDLRENYNFRLECLYEDCSNPLKQLSSGLSAIGVLMNCLRERDGGGPTNLVWADLGDLVTEISNQILQLDSVQREIVAALRKGGAR